jgi:hypothetical protein
MDATTRLLVDRYNTYVSSANFTAANELLRDNPSLRQVVMVAEDYNRMRDGLIAVQRIFNGYIADYIINVVKSKGVWSSTVEYDKYSVVTYEYDNVVKTYICLPQDETLLKVPAGFPPIDTRYWACITMGGKQGVSGTGFAPRGSYDADKVYYKDDLVIYNGFFYIGTTTAAEDPHMVTETNAILYMDGTNGYIELPVGSKVDPNGSYYTYDSESGTYEPVSDLSSYGVTYSAPYEIHGETPSSEAQHWTLLALSNVEDKLIAGRTIAATDWVDGVATIQNENVTESTLVEVLFNANSFEDCSMSGIYVNSINGAIELHCMNEVPTNDIVVDYFRLRIDRTI